jgi:ABC-2 type transport system ATP-binding protein
MLEHDQSLEAKKQIGVVPENLALFDNLTALEYLTFIGRIHGIPRDVIRLRSDEMLNLLSLERETKKLVLEYSHGMRKKLALASALLANPKLLFLDEPFEGVDAVASLTIRELLASYVAGGCTVFLTSHVLEIVERLCTHVGIIMNGKLILQSSMSDIHDSGTLEQVFLQSTGSDRQTAPRLDWLEQKKVS